MRRRRSLLILAVVSSTAVASCTTELSSTPAPTLTSTTSTTTTAPPDTVAATTTTTEPPTTTTAETTVPDTAPDGPVGITVPLFAGGDQGAWLTLGSWDVTEWNDATTGSQLSVGAALSISSLAGTSTAVVGAPSATCAAGGTGPSTDVTIAPPEPPGFGFGAIAVPDATWDLRPRPLAVAATGPASYDQLGAAAFAGTAVDGSLGAVEQVVVTDLDGDGDDEAIIAYEYVQATSPAPGDLAAILLVDAVTRNPSTVRRSLVPVPVEATGTSTFERFRVMDVADYNGDGTMEVALHSWIGEEPSVVVYAYDGAVLTAALSGACTP